MVPLVKRIAARSSSEALSKAGARCVESVDVARPAGGQGEDRLERGAGRRELGLLLLVDEEGAHVARPDEVGQLRDRKLIVQGHDDGPGGQDREVGHGPFRAVLARDGDLVPLADAEGPELSGDGLRLGQGLPVGQGYPVRLVDREAVLVREPRGRQGQELGKGRPAPAEVGAAVLVEEFPGIFALHVRPPVA
jgi:hypothetical protein